MAAHPVKLFDGVPGTWGDNGDMFFGFEPSAVEHGSMRRPSCDPSTGDEAMWLGDRWDGDIDSLFGIPKQSLSTSYLKDLNCHIGTTSCFFLGLGLQESRRWQDPFHVAQVEVEVRIPTHSVGVLFFPSGGARRSLLEEWHSGHQWTTLPAVSVFTWRRQVTSRSDTWTFT